MGSIEEKISAVEAAIVRKPPFCSGRVQIDERSSTLFYKTDEGKIARYLSLASATTEELEILTNACLPAKFGLGNEDVYDESYRKARKMDIDAFMVGFNPSAILDVIREELLEGQDTRSHLEVELYKLNVYDKGSFFNAHRDTPRRRDMFASLVIIFPTPHQGGKLLLRHDREEWSFDSSQILSGSSTSTAAFIAFYSDVEHEVTLVESGHRVTLTYNIYRGSQNTPTHVNLVSEKYDSTHPGIVTVPGGGQPRSTQSTTRNPDHSLLKTTITNLLLDPTCLPTGGYFGFGLRFMYPAFGGSQFDLQEMIKHLKGSDAILHQICVTLTLQTSLCVLAHHKGDDTRWFLLSNAVDLSDKGELMDLEEAFDDLDTTMMGVHDWTAATPLVGMSKPIVWLSPKTEYVTYETVYLAYGNEAALGNLYGYVCLVAEVGPCARRETLEEEEEEED